MKKITLLVLFSTLLTSIYAQSAYDAFHQPNKKLYPDRITATDRSDFPVLLVDSTYFEYWYNNVIDNQEYTKFFYDPAELQIAEHRHNVYLNQGGPASITNSITSYAYDLDKRLILSQTARTSEFGDYIGEQKEETVYNGSGIKNYTLTGWGKNAPLENWQPQYKRIVEGDDTYSTDLYGSWDASTSAFVPVNRFSNTFSPLGDILSAQSETWNGSNWVVTYLRESTYDAQGNLLTNTYSYGNPSVPLAPASRDEYIYDANGRQITTLSYNWDAFATEWVLIRQTEHIYNAQDEKIESIGYAVSVNGELVKGNHVLYTYGPGVYTTSAEEILHQNWNPDTQEYLDVNRDRYIYSDLPNGQVLLELDFSNKEIPGQGDWLTALYGNVFFVKSQISSVPGSPAEKSCTVPNPYPSGFQVQCDQLKTEASYMLWVYDMNGKEVYAKHFKGGEGWSINSNLHTGTYFAVITQNNRRVSSYKIIAGK